MRRKLVLLFLLFIIGALVYTNPSADDFTAYLQKMIARVRAGGQEDIEKFLIGFPEDIDEKALLRTSTRHNYYLWSVYEVPGGKGQSGLRVLGFARRIFIPLGTGRPQRDIPIY